MARTCCSTWLVTAPAIVQWPLLWTRGASSVTTSDPSGMRNSSEGASTVPTAAPERTSQSSEGAA